MSQRLELDRYLMTLAWAASLRSTCRVKHGAIVSVSGDVVSTGYNGSLPGYPHCSDLGCLMQPIRERERCVRTKHAEDNALRKARGRGNWLHCTGQPCYECLTDIIVAGHIERVVWWQEYPDTLRDAFWISGNMREIEMARIEMPAGMADMERMLLQ